MNAPPVPTIPTQMPIIRPAASNAIIENFIYDPKAKQWCVQRRPRSIRLPSDRLSLVWTVAMNEVAGRHSLFAFWLKFENLERSVASATKKKFRTARKQFSLGNFFRSRFGCGDIQHLSPKGRECPGPR